MQPQDLIIVEGILTLAAIDIAEQGMFTFLLMRLTTLGWQDDYKEMSLSEDGA